MTHTYTVCDIYVCTLLRIANIQLIAYALCGHAHSYATAIAIVVTCLLSVPLYGTVPSAAFLQGMLLVIASIFMYNAKPRVVGKAKP